MPLQRRDARDLQVPELLRLVLSKVPSTASAEAGLMHKGIIGWLGSSRLEAPAQEPSAQEVAKATATITAKGTEELLRELEAHLAKRIDNGDQDAGTLRILVDKMREQEATNVAARKDRETEAEAKKAARLAERNSRRKQEEELRNELERGTGRLAPRAAGIDISSGAAAAV